MTSSTVNILKTNEMDNTDELTNMLESLPSYENLQETQDESVIFNENNESMTGLINLIRSHSIHQSQTDIANELPNTVRIILK